MKINVQLGLLWEKAHFTVHYGKSSTSSPCISNQINEQGIGPPQLVAVHVETYKEEDAVLGMPAIGHPRRACKMSLVYSSGAKQLRGEQRINNGYNKALNLTWKLP